METTGNIVTYDLVKFRNVLDLLVSCTENHRFRFSEKRRTSFTREYLIDFLKPLRDVNDVVTVCLGVDYPLIIQTIGDENIKVFLASRIEQ